MRGLLLFLLMCASLSAQGTSDSDAQSGPKQPIAFSHKLHVSELKQPCQMCHANTEGGELVEMPDTPKCLSCHSGIPPRTPGEQKLAAFGKLNRDIDWVRVYQIPTFVRFEHRQHGDAKVGCEACHGRVASQTVVAQDHDLSMGTCMNCHRQMHASLDCGSCHEPR